MATANLKSFPQQMRGDARMAAEYLLDKVLKISYAIDTGTKDFVAREPVDLSGYDLSSLPAGFLNHIEFREGLNLGDQDIPLPNIRVTRGTFHSGSSRIDSLSARTADLPNLKVSGQDLATNRIDVTTALNCKEVDTSDLSALPEDQRAQMVRNMQGNSHLPLSVSATGNIILQDLPLDDGLNSLQAKNISIGANPTGKRVKTGAMSRIEASNILQMAEVGEVQIGKQSTLSGKFIDLRNNDAIICGSGSKLNASELINFENSYVDAMPRDGGSVGISSPCHLNGADFRLRGALTREQVADAETNYPADIVSIPNDPQNARLHFENAVVHIADDARLESCTISGRNATVYARGTILPFPETQTPPRTTGQTVPGGLGNISPADQREAETATQQLPGNIGNVRPGEGLDPAAELTLPGGLGSVIPGNLRNDDPAAVQPLGSAAPYVPFWKRGKLGRLGEKISAFGTSLAERLGKLKPSFGKRAGNSVPPLPRQLNDLLIPGDSSIDPAPEEGELKPLPEALRENKVNRRAFADFLRNELGVGVRSEQRADKTFFIVDGSVSLAGYDLSEFNTLNLNSFEFGKDLNLGDQRIKIAEGTNIYVTETFTSGFANGDVPEKYNLRANKLYTPNMDFGPNLDDVPAVAKSYTVIDKRFLDLEAARHSQPPSPVPDADITLPPATPEPAGLGDANAEAELADLKARLAAMEAENNRLLQEAAARNQPPADLSTEIAEETRKAKEELAAFMKASAERRKQQDLPDILKYQPASTARTSATVAPTSATHAYNAKVTAGYGEANLPENTVQPRHEPSNEDILRALGHLPEKEETAAPAEKKTGPEAKLAPEDHELTEDEKIAALGHMTAADPTEFMDQAPAHEWEAEKPATETAPAEPVQHSPATEPTMSEMDKVRGLYGMATHEHDAVPAPVVKVPEQPRAEMTEGQKVSTFTHMVHPEPDIGPDTIDMTELEREIEAAARARGVEIPANLKEEANRGNR